MSSDSHAPTQEATTDPVEEARLIIGGMLDLGAQPQLVDRARRWLDEAEAGRHIGVGWDGGSLHPESVKLVAGFAAALAGKLAGAEAKYGRCTDWLVQDWEAELQRDLARHVEKGDPLDVAAYAAFAWARGYRTGPMHPVDALEAIAARAGLETDPAAMAAMRAHCDELVPDPDQLQRAAAWALRDFLELVEASEGVYGLHQNGDPAPWGELLAGGRFEDWTANIEALRVLLHGLHPAGRCRICGCTEDNACDPPCGWADSTATLCNSDACLAAAHAAQRGQVPGDMGLGSREQSFSRRPPVEGLECMKGHPAAD
jgi:hypothetical protein